MNSTKWANSEFKDIKLGDKRLSKRLIKIADDFLSSSESPINQACGCWSQTKAAYRFFQNENIDYQDIVKHHAELTKSRFKSEDIVLAIQDTSYFNYSAHPNTKNLGVLSRFTGKYKKDIITSGLYMHTTLAINTNGLPLGILDQKICAREVLSKEKMDIKKRSHNIALPIEEKESVRWLNSMKRSVDLFSDKKLVTIADREADIYDLFLLAGKLNSHYLIRSSHNRNINKSAIHSDISGEKLLDFMRKQKILGKVTVNVPATDKLPKRIAKCSVKIGKFKLLPPRSYKGDKSTELELTINSIQVIEDKPPKNVKKIEWLLHTNLPIDNIDDALEKIKWYCLRWRIEVYFKVIKSGFNVESCRLETADRLIRYLAVISIVAWRVFWLTMISRSMPQWSASEVFEDNEWKVLFVKFHPSRKIPNKSPPLIEVVTWIAQLGGFMARKGDGIPGITHMWRGLKNLFDLVSGIRLYERIYG